MKNIKNTITAMALTAVLGMGATAANAGMMLGDRSATPAQTVCSNGGSILSQLEGIIILGFAEAKSGIMMSDRSNTPCTQNTIEGQDGDGILIIG